MCGAFGVNKWVSNLCRLKERLEKFTRHERLLRILRPTTRTDLVGDLWAKVALKAAKVLNRFRSEGLGS